MTNHELAGEVAIVSGGAKNLGGLISRQFGEAGANVAVLLRRRDSGTS